MAQSIIKKHTTIQSGTAQSDGVPANSYKDITITFSGFTTTPNVVCNLWSSSTAAKMGLLTVATQSITTTSAVLRVFNADTTTRNPSIQWIAVG